MGCLAIISAFALLQFSLGSAHSVARFQAHKGYDVNVVDENKEANRISFINPKSDKPTLREIVYYHMIEKPYPETNAAKLNGTVDDDIDTERPFTKSHGFPFVKDENVYKNETTKETEIAPKGNNNVKTVEKKSDESDIDEFIEEEPPAESEGVGEEEEPLETSDSDHDNPETIAFKEPVKTTKATTVTNKDSNKNVPETTSQVDVKNNDDKEVQPETITQTEILSKTTEKSSKTNKTSEADDAAAANFVNWLNSKNNTPVNMTSPPEDATNITTSTESYLRTNEIGSPTTEASMSERRKIFDRIKSKYAKLTHPNVNLTVTSSRRKRSAHLMEIPEAPTLPGMNLGPIGRSRRSGSGDAKQEIKNKIEKMFDAVSKKIRSKSANDDNDEPPKPRTYGMKLTADHGVVWNDMFTNPGVKYSVGNPEASSIEENPSEETPSESNEPTEEDNETTEEEEQQETTTHNYDLDDIEVNMTKKKEKPKEENHTTEAHTEAQHEETTEAVTPKVEQQEDKKSEESRPEDKHEETKQKEENHEKDVESQEKTEEAPKIKSVKHDDDDSDHHKIEVPRRRKPMKEHKEESHQESHEEEKPASIKDKKLDALNVLLGNKQFWEWLGDWTSIYMEVFVQNVEKIIREEIKKQFANVAKDNSTITSDNHHQDHHDDSNKLESKKDEEHAGGMLKHKTHKDHKKPHKADKKAHKDEKKAPAVDKKKEMNSNNTGTSTKVESNTMYGNSVNNEKVTNIFIFYPDEKSNKIIENLQPILSSSDKNTAADHKEDEHKKPEAHDTKLDEKKDTETKREENKPAENKKPSKPVTVEQKKEKEDEAHKEDETKHKKEDKKPEDKTDKSAEKDATTSAPSTISSESSTKAQTSPSSTISTESSTKAVTKESSTTSTESTTKAVTKESSTTPTESTTKAVTKESSMTPTESTTKAVTKESSTTPTESTTKAVTKESSTTPTESTTKAVAKESSTTPKATTQTETTSKATTISESTTTAKSR